MLEPSEWSNQSLGRLVEGRQRSLVPRATSVKGVSKSYSLKSEGVQYSLAIAKYYGMLQPILKQLFK